MLNRLIKFIQRWREIDVNIIFVSYLLAFIIDRLTNYFTAIPVFVIFGLLTFPLIAFHKSIPANNRRWMAFLGLPFILVSVANNYIFGLHAKNISDLLFILLFFLFYFLYSSQREKLNTKWLHLMTISFIVLYSFTFAGINSIKPIFSDNSLDNYKGPPPNSNSEEKLSLRDFDKVYQQPVRQKAFHEKVLQSLADPSLDYLEYFRVYNKGLFRVPQVASCFFGFLALFYFYFFWNRNKLISLLSAALLIFIVLYTGTRVFPLTFAAVTFLWFLIRPRRWPYIIPMIVALGLLIVYRFEIIELTKDTFVFQYFTFFATAIDNLPRLSRIMFWKSWITEIQEFGILELLAGKTYYLSLEANLKNLYIVEWFHNDFLSISYSYGLICLALYISFFVKIYKDNRKLIKKNFFVFALYFLMLLTAFINGFYYYFPTLTLFIYFSTINLTQPVISHENRDPGDKGHTE